MKLLYKTQYKVNDILLNILTANITFRMPCLCINNLIILCKIQQVVITLYGWYSLHYEELNIEKYGIWQD